jgi:hypothetical protein
MSIPEIYEILRAHPYAGCDSMRAEKVAQLIEDVVSKHIAKAERALAGTMSNGMDEWISVKDRLPKPNVYVLWASRKEPGNFLRPVVEGYYELWTNGMQFWRESIMPSIPFSLSEVTHWQPLPAPPKGATE